MDTPLDRSTVWPYEDGEPGPFVYSRFANPTCIAADEALGALVFRDAELAARVRTFRSRTGIVAAPETAWLLLRGLKTLRLRVERQTETARELARRLEAHPGVSVVRYAGFGGLLSFDVAD